MGGVFLDAVSFFFNTFDHALFADNSAGPESNIFDFSSISPVQFDHVTAVNNQGLEDGAFNLGVCEITNSIFSNNTPEHFGAAYGNLLWSDIHFMNDTLAGTWEDTIGIINTDPLFANPDLGDYYLQPDSPCIDAGDPDYTPDPDGSVTDLGAYPFSPFYECELMGDTNLDGAINVQDIITLINFIINLVPCLCADMNQSGEVDVLDAILIVNLILEPELVPTQGTQQKDLITSEIRQLIGQLQVQSGMRGGCDEYQNK